MYYLPFKIIRFASRTFGLSSHIPKITSSIFRGFDNNCSLLLLLVKHTFRSRIVLQSDSEITSALQFPSHFDRNHTRKI